MFSRTVVLSLAIVMLAGCSALPRHQAVPFEKTNQAVIPWLENARYIADDPKDMERMNREVLALWEMQSAWLTAQGQSLNDLPPAAFLAISGGGDKGAYTAGLLNGWSKAGTRPNFTLVTGISTGSFGAGLPCRMS